MSGGQAAVALEMFVPAFAAALVWWVRYATGRRTRPLPALVPRRFPEVGAVDDQRWAEFLAGHQ